MLVEAVPQYCHFWYRLFGRATAKFFVFWCALENWPQYHDTVIVVRESETEDPQPVSCSLFFVSPVFRDLLLPTPPPLLSRVSSALSPLRPGCSLGSDARITTDCALHGTDAVACLLGIQPVLQRRKADALRTSNIYVQEAVSSTCRHFPAKGLRVCTWNTRGLLVLPSRARDRG